MHKTPTKKQKQNQNKQDTMTHLQGIKTNKQLIVTVPEYPKMLSLVEKNTSNVLF